MTFHPHFLLLTYVINTDVNFKEFFVLKEPIKNWKQYKNVILKNVYHVKEMTI